MIESFFVLYIQFVYFRKSSKQQMIQNCLFAKCQYKLLSILSSTIKMFQSTSQEKKRNIDISLLYEYKLNTNSDWVNWSFDNEEYEHIPLGFNNKYNLHKNVKFCDPHSLQQSQEDEDFLVVEQNIKKKDKAFISKNVKINENRQAANPFKRVYNKKQQRNFGKWTNQIKTNFKKITVKNNWTQLNTITKNSLDNLPQLKNLKIKNIKTVGKLSYINPEIERTHWQQKKFKQTGYTVDPIKTASDKHLTQIAVKLMEEEDSSRINVICNPTFLLALLTVRAAIYPWNIQIQKVGNSIVLQSFKGHEDQNQKLNYLDLFTINQNTLNNMPLEEAKLKQNCINATKMTKIFQDLLASGDQVERQEIQEQFPEQEAEEQKEEDEEEGDQQQQEQEEGEKEEQITKIRKYLKISLDKIDIYTYVQIDGAKKNSTTGQLEYYLIRTFMQNETQGVWVKNMQTTGSLITKEYQSNICSLQKWICEAHLAGVNEIKTGFIGYTQNKSLALLNVDQISVKGLQNTMSQFRFENCWVPVKYILNLLTDLEDGTYVLAKAPYTPLSIKLYQIYTNDEQQEEAGEEEEKKQQEAKQ